MKIIETLRDHVTYNCEAQKKPYYFSILLSKLPELRSLSARGIDHISSLRSNQSVQIPSELEKLFNPMLFV